MEKFQEIDIKQMGNPTNTKESKQTNLNIDLNQQINNNVNLHVPAMQPRIQGAPECKIKFFILKKKSREISHKTNVKMPDNNL